MGKTKCIREAIEALGIDCTLRQAQTWLKQKYGMKKVADSTFYNVRRNMKQISRPPITALIVENEPTNGIVALVQQLKMVVEKIGKNETKKLVDVL